MRAGALVPGLGDARTLRLGPAAPAVGATLKQIDLRGLSGAAGIAIDRGPHGVVYPTADERLRAGDTLVLTGTADAVDNARRLLLGEGEGGSMGA